LIEQEIERSAEGVLGYEEIWKGREGSGPGFGHIRKNRSRQSGIIRVQREGKFDQAAELAMEASATRGARRRRPRRRFERQADQLLRTQVGAEEIAEVVSRATGIRSAR